MPGYLLSEAYPAFYHREQAPLWLRSVAQALGGTVPEVTADWCEIGCGQGFGAAILAAANPGQDFTAIDLNPGHIATAQARAKAAGLDNLTFHCADLCKVELHTDGGELQRFGYIGSHGVLSWVPADVRAAIAAFSARHLGRNGLASHHYMSEPGGAAFRSFHSLFRSFAGQEDAVAKGLAALCALRDAGAGFFQTHPHAAPTLARLLQEPPAYVAHEYLNPEFEPLGFADVAAMMQAAGLSWRGSATPLENIDAVSLPALAGKAIAGVQDPVLREQMKDLARNQALRIDLFSATTEGLADSLADGAHLAGLRAQTWMALPAAPAPGKLTFQTRFGPVEGDAAIFGPLLQALSKGKARFAELERIEPFTNRPGLLNQALQMALWGGIAHPCAAQVDKAPAARLNRLLLREAAVGGHIPALAAPAIGSGLAVTPAILADLAAGRGDGKLRHLFCLD